LALGINVKSTSPAIASVELAFWDLVGEACGQPLVSFFGGRVREGSSSSTT
jgi:L-Ala-D/L-Glu epimerase